MVFEPPPTSRPGPGLARTLLAWFRRERRALPWRGTRDPYRIWVAEVLLQQTRVAQAIPYYHRFLRRFPNVRALARAPEERVLRAWQGAGYYARARNLHRAATLVLRDHQGRLPTSPAELEELPGFGPYIARAVASLAYDAHVVALEANGRRVAIRLWADDRAGSSTLGTRRLERRLAHLLPSRGSGDFNEALMELGETICLPRTPRCPVCPVRRYCRAFATLRSPGLLPSPRRRPRRPHVRAAVVVLGHGDRLLVQRRPPSGLLGGLYEFPGGKIAPGEAAEQAGRREVLEETGIPVSRLEPLGVVRHAYSHFTVELHAFRAQLRGARPQLAHPSQRWVSRAELVGLPLPRATEKVLSLFGNAEGR